jgi:hypothetical protein
MTVDQYIQASVSLLLDIRNNTRPEGTPALSFVDLFPEGAPPLVNAPPSAVPAATAKRGCGRPVAGEAAQAAQTPSVAATTPAEPDPFDTPAPVVAAPAATLDEVRAAMKALAAATTQDNALKVLKEAGGVANLTELQRTPEKYGVVVAAAKAQLPTQTAAAEDPFETTAAPTQAVPEQAAPSKEDVKAALVKAQKRTGVDTVQAVVMKHGGKAPGEGGKVGPSLTALPVSAYAAVIAEVTALPTTK